MKLRWICAQVIICINFAGLLSASQLKMGGIRIEVKDQFGSPMQANGKLEGLGGGGDRTFETDDQGRYVFSMLPYGRYRLEVSRDGFATQSELIDVQSDAATSRTVTMAVGASAYRVE